MHAWLVQWMRWCLVVLVVMGGGRALAASVDLSVSSYDWKPDNVYNGALVDFTVKVSNSGISGNAAAGARLEVPIPANMQFQSGTWALPGGSCTYAASTLTCSLPALAQQSDVSLKFQAQAIQPTAMNSTAVVTVAAGDTDSNPGNDTLPKTITAQEGTDLYFVSHGADQNPVPAGEKLAFSVVVGNHGPNAASKMTVTLNLPPAGDYGSPSASGAGWSCGAASGNRISCEWSGAAVAVGGQASAITVTGTVLKVSGGSTLTHTASVSVPSGALSGDPVPTNNEAAAVVVDITPATTLVGRLTMQSSKTGTPVFVKNDPGFMILAVQNQGPFPATGVTVKGDIPAGFTPGTMPAGCTLAGSTVTCTVGALQANTLSSDFKIPVTSGAATAQGSASATPARVGPVEGKNTAGSGPWSVVDDYANLDLTKTKRPASPKTSNPNEPVKNGDLMLSTITVTNSPSSTSAAGGTLTITDLLLSSYEKYDHVDAPWACSEAADGVHRKLTCTYTVPAGNGIAVGAKAPDLKIYTQVDLTGLPAGQTHVSLGNQACPVASPDQVPPAKDVVCQNASIVAGTVQADLAITKTVNTANVTATTNSYSYTLTVKNNNAVDPQDASQGVVDEYVVEDDLQGFYVSVSGLSTKITPVASPAVGAGESCGVDAAHKLTCTFKDFNPQTTRTITITLERPFATDGTAKTNTATVFAPHVVDPDPANNSASVPVTIVPVADVAVTGVAPTQGSLQVGVKTEVTVSIKNLGANDAAEVKVDILIPAGLLLDVASLVSPANFSCSAITSAGPVTCTANAGTKLKADQTLQPRFSVTPDFSLQGKSAGFTGTISTTTYDSNSSNDSNAAQLAVLDPKLDISVKLTEAHGYQLSPTSSVTKYDPVGFEDEIKYLAVLTNTGPSLASEFSFEIDLAPPSGFDADYVSITPATLADVNAAGTSATGNFVTANAAALAACVRSARKLTCQLDSTLAHSQLPANASTAVLITYKTKGGTAPKGSITYTASAQVTSKEVTGGAGFEGPASNNAVTETTTVYPKTDLAIAKTVSKPVVDLNEPFTYTLTVTNKGPSTAYTFKVTDDLPAGLMLNGPATIAQGTLNCSTGAQPGSYGQLVCDVEISSGLADQASVALTIPVRAAYPKDGTSFPAFAPTKISNVGKVSPTNSLDPNDANQSTPAEVEVRKNSIAGVTYSDDDGSKAFTSGEGIPNVTVTLTGTDAYGHEFGAGKEYPFLTVKTDAQGNFLFDKLPPGNWTVVETQPVGYYDSLETLGTAGGNKPADACDGALNCSSAAASNTISAITLAKDVATAATGYAFEELKAAQIKGWVYEDSNNNAALDAGENKIAAASTVVLTGTAYNGQALSTFGLTLSQASNASGYSFTGLPPSNGLGYTVQQTVEPTGYLNGKTSVQPEADAHNTAGKVAAAGVYGNTIEQIVLHSAGVATGNNFGELKSAAISGYAFIDGNKNAFRDGVDTSGVTGMTVTLTGTDDKGPVNVTVSTGVSGAYSFPDLRPGTYQVSITPISGMNHVGAQIGDKGGKSGAASGPSVGSGVQAATHITDITLAAGEQGQNYNFGQSGEGLSGKVYVDLNGNGVLDSGEPGIQGVKITLSGLTKDGRDVCVVISPQPCTTTTGADGGYNFVGLPESGTAGYTLTEQAQAEAPLNRYLDGQETVGTLGGAAGNDVISGIKLAGTFGSNYNFGEKGIDLPGRVFVDSNGDTQPGAGEPGLPGVTITLSGTTVDGQDVCTVLAAQGRSCTVQTGGDGKFKFSGLPAGNYTLTETQPKDYANSSNTPGNAGGTGSDEPNGDSKFSNITLTPSSPTVTEYLFAEKTGGLSGYVYHDKNGNSVRDNATDPGIAGVTVTVTGTTEQGDPVSLTTTTDANGYYSFHGLHNGSYTVTETQPAGWLDGKTSKGLVAGSECTACVNSTGNVIASIKFTADKAYTEFNFGEVKGTSISGSVYHDVNEDGHLNPQEGLGGVTVTLTGTDDLGNPVTKTTTTGPDGKYSFPDLRPSDSNGYTLTETQPADIGDFPAGGGQPGTVQGNPAGSSTQPNVITGVVLKSGESGEEYNFRDKASTLAGTVYRDDNDNGLLDSNERGLSNVTVTLTGTSSSGAAISRTTTTDDQGNYRFVGLPSGNYQLVETQPSGMLDGKEKAGTKGGTVDNSQFCDAAPCNTISNIPLGQAENATGYLFGERGGSLSGTVYADLNNSGTKDANEQGLAGVVVTLSGTTATGEDICSLRGAAFCTAVTDANGNYKFEGVPPGVYQLAKSQNQVNELFSAQYADGKETAGVVGGKVENRYFGTQPGYNAIASISLTADAIAANAGNIGGYLFGVVPTTSNLGVLPPVVSGYVYMDHSHDRVRDPFNTDGQFDWTATLSTSTGQQICVVQTNSEGFYQFDNLNCPQYPQGLPTTDSLPGHPTFSIRFTKDGNVLPSLTSSGDNAGTVGGGQITNLVLKNTDVLVEQNLPLDPEGVVYDAVTRKPVAGAVVGIAYNGTGVFDPSVHLVGGASFQNQTTGADGRYSFILQNAYPSGEYVLTIQSVPQAYLPGTSAMIPPCVNTLNVTLLPGGMPALMQGQREAPGLSQALHNPQTCPVSTSGFANTAPFTAQQQSTQYYLKFNITRGGSSEILNNHIPLDPVLAGGAILVTKTTPKVNVAKADLVPYTITATNMSGGALANVRVRDMLPPGFRYRKGSATWNKLPVEPEVNGRELTWPNQSFATNEKKTYQLLLTVGAGVGEGEYVNQAWAINSQVNERISNVASATVRVVPDPTFDCSDLIGKVFDDKNANGYQDQGEPGIPNVRVVTARGLLVTTDAEGRFHVACAAIPQADRGSNFVMKLDERTLPSGFRMTTENPRDVRVTRGKMVKLNFGATVHKVLRLEVDARAFAQDGKQLSAQWDSQVEPLITQLAQRPTVLRIAYRLSGGEDRDVAAQRLKALTERIQNGYAQRAQQQKEKEDDTPPLVIETESFEQNKAEGVR